MSKCVELRTTVTDEQYLVEALRELGHQPEVCREGRPLVGYLGDKRAELAQIIIPRGQLDSASNDIGCHRLRLAQVPLKRSNFVLSPSIWRFA